jgi:hypothetical protein
MRAINIKIIFASLVTIAISIISGCATDGKISAIFFPKERAAKAADNVIDEIFGAPPAAATTKSESTKK